MELAYIPPTFAAASITTVGLYFLNHSSRAFLLNRSKCIGRTGKAWHTAVAFHKNRLLQRVLSSWSGKENRSEAINIRDGINKLITNIANKGEKI